jgi:NAD(P)-dependent dehydrogenase (short-subunit alcohol dehydrogenase family)
MNRLQGKSVIVTGAGSGIGAATVQRLHSEGAAVIAVDLVLPELDLPSGSSAYDDRILSMVTDVTDRKQVAHLLTVSTERFGTPYGLVNSAGIRGVGNILDVEPEELDRVLRVNLAGTLNTCQAFAKALAQSGAPGSIVNVASSAGIRAVPNRLAYVASKFGVVGTTQTMALELAPSSIRVNAVAPGMIRTPMTASMFELDPEGIAAAHPIGRAGEPHEIASAIAFLLSDDASFITGAILPVDGGGTVGIASFGGR